jgi:hypothetical protein
VYVLEIPSPMLFHTGTPSMKTFTRGLGTALGLFMPVQVAAIFTVLTLQVLSTKDPAPG